MPKLKHMIYMWLLGWAAVLEGICSILTLGLFRPKLELRIILFFLDSGWFDA